MTSHSWYGLTTADTAEGVIVIFISSTGCTDKVVWIFCGIDRQFAGFKDWQP